ncbi:amidase [Rhodobacteraceae bacterium SC52]|nr:amidase [Rhodobacteraceae bacterium SC52]
MAQDWRRMSAAALGRGIAAGQIDPVALCEAFLDAIAADDPDGRIYARTMPDRARAQAQGAASRARAGVLRGPLDGVPVSWKDLVDIAGTGCESGSQLLAGRVPTRDAYVVQLAEAAGVVSLGKTHLSELAFSGLGYNPMTATPPHATNPDAVPGGSSSGAAASLAFGLAGLAVGSDTGGSVRLPAGWNDLVGLKTTSGRVSLKGVVPLCARFDTIGPLARTVEDAALMLAALEGSTVPDLRGARLSGMRLAVLETVALDDLDPKQAQAFEGALARLEAGGAHLTRFTVPELPDAMGLAPTLYPAEAWGTWGEVISANPDRMYDRVRERFEGGKGISGPDFVAAWQRLNGLRADWTECVAAFDAVILPTTANVPPPVARIAADPDFYVAQNLLALRNTRIGNLMGGCSLTIPTGVPSCGLMMMTPPMQEARLLCLGAAAESALA